jgi:HlyD family secretion protein
LRQGGTVKATIRSRALPKELSGTVSRVGRLIARNTVLDIDPTADADRRVFEVVVTLDGDSNAVAGQFLNLQVQVFFTVGEW